MHTINFNTVILFIFLSFSLCAHSHPGIPQPSRPKRPSATTSTEVVVYGPSDPYPRAGDHPDWKYLNAIPWYITDPTQQDHARFHAILSMSAYSSTYAQDCPKTFTAGFHVLFKFSLGYAALIPEMEKVTLIFKGPTSNYKQLNWTAVTIEDLVPNCPNCMVARAVKDYYNQLRRETNDFAIATQTARKQKLKYSATGHGFGGAIAALASLHLGSLDVLHYSHNQGLPRFMNTAAVVRYDNLFQALAGQSLVAGNDYSVQVVPPGPFYHIGTKINIHGKRSQWLVNCYGDNENSTCLGNGSSQQDHLYYFARIGTCGSKDKGF